MVETSERGRFAMLYVHDSGPTDEDYYEVASPVYLSYVVGYLVGKSKRSECGQENKLIKITSAIVSFT